MNIQTPNHRHPIHGWQLFSLLAVLIVTMTVLIVVLNPDLVAGTRSAIRATARSSCVFTPSARHPHFYLRATESRVLA
jgi:hypothetical protein